MNQDDAKDEAEFQTCRAQVLSALLPYANPVMKVYALLDAAAFICTDSNLLRGAFDEVMRRNRREK